MTALWRGWTVGCLVLLSACALQPPKDDSLYRELGERPGINRIVEGMLINIAHDSRINRHFQHVEPVRLRDQLVLKFCMEAGGPCRYTGDSMAEVHKGQNIGKAEFNALVEDLIASMDTQGVPVPSQNRLLARLAAQRGDVIKK